MRSASVVVVASGSTRWPGLEAKVNPMNINQPRILAVAALLALAGLATPTTAQDPSPEDCIPGAFPPETAACEAYLASLTEDLPAPDVTCVEDFDPTDCVPAGTPCAAGEVGSAPACVDDPTDPAPGVPCIVEDDPETPENDPIPESCEGSFDESVVAAVCAVVAQGEEAQCEANPSGYITAQVTGNFAPSDGFFAEIGLLVPVYDVSAGFTLDLTAWSAGDGAYDVPYTGSLLVTIQRDCGALVDADVTGEICQTGPEDGAGLTLPNGGGAGNEYTFEFTAEQLRSDVFGTLPVAAVNIIVQQASQYSFYNSLAQAVFATDPAMADQAEANFFTPIILLDTGVVTEQLAVLAPTAEAGAGQDADEGSSVTLDGSASASTVPVFTPTYSWVQIAGPEVTLDGEDTANPTFTAPLFDADDNVLSFELTVSDESTATTTDTVDVMILDINPEANAGEALAIDEGMPDVALDGSSSRASAVGQTLTYAWSQLSGLDVVIADSTQAIASFDAPVLVDLMDEPQVLTFVLTVEDDFGLDSTEVTVTINPTHVQNGQPVYVTVGEEQVILTSSGPETPFAPSPGMADSEFYVLYVRDDNGLNTVQDNLVGATVTGPAGSLTFTADDAVKTTTCDTSGLDIPTCSMDNVNVYTFTVDTPAIIQDGTYTFTPSYNSVPGPIQQFSVANVAPTMDFEAGAFDGRAVAIGNDAAQTVAVKLTLDDLNWGSIDGATASSELDDLVIEVFGAADLTFDTPLTGFAVQFDGVDSLDGTLDLSGDESEGLDVDVLVLYADTVAAGSYVVRATLTDLGSEPLTAEASILTIDLVPANFGFTLTLNDDLDGLAGIQLAEASPGQTTSNLDDPLHVVFTGTVAATLLDLDLDTFTSGPNSFSPGNAIVSVEVYDVNPIGGQEIPVESFDMTAGAVSLDLGSLVDELGQLNENEEIFLVFVVTLPVPIADGAYTSTVDVVGHSG